MNTATVPLINEPLYALNVASKLSGIPAHSIRQYIDKGILIPFKSGTNRHLFSQVDITCLKHIHEQLNKQGLNIAGIKALMAQIPCWALRKCPAGNRNNCPAYHSIMAPCWEASEKNRTCKNDDCRACDVYRIASGCMDAKSLMKALL